MDITLTCALCGSKKTVSQLSIVFTYWICLPAYKCNCLNKTTPAEVKAIEEQMKRNGIK